MIQSHELTLMWLEAQKEYVGMCSICVIEPGTMYVYNFTHLQCK